MIATLVTILLQFVAVYLLGFVLALASGVGNGWELVVFVVGGSLGVWSVGVIATHLHSMGEAQQHAVRLWVTVIGSIAGAAVILLTPPLGFVEVIFPFSGALLRYYAPALLRRLGSKDARTP